MSPSVHVLLIDEDRAWCAFVSQVLSTGGFTSSRAATLGDGLHFRSRRTPDVIICNCDYPELDALNTLLTLRTDQQLSRVPILLVSKRPSREKAQAARLAGAADFLPKPAAPGEIIAKVARAALFAI